MKQFYSVVCVTDHVKRET